MYDLAEIKKLPIEERKLAAIELIENIEEEMGETFYFELEEDAETAAMLKERFEEFGRGETKFIPWDEAKKKLLKKFTPK